ncbi:hypothetical protein LSAT2_021918, partial [Lamellibrachia satsuma]
PPTLIVIPAHSDIAFYKPDRPSHTDPDEMEPEVCDIIIEEGVANRIAYTCRRSQLTLDEVLTNTCQDITSTMMSPEWQDEIKKQILETNPGL